MEPCKESSQQTSYFVLKCSTLENLQTCIETSIWACRDRVSPPHPRQLLTEACSKGNLIFIFSVNNQHGWHGYCELTNQANHIPNSSESTDQIKGCSDSEEEKEPQTTKSDIFLKDNSSGNYAPTDLHESAEQDVWYRFKVLWKRHFQEFNKQECLSLSYTKDFNLADGSPLNKARNWQELPCEIGKKLCSLIDQHYKELSDKRAKLEEEQLSQKMPSFFKNEEAVVHEQIHAGGWDAVLHKVETELGKVHLACPFGSQRYNCSGPDSDSDIFLVYQAKTVDMLGLDPPKQTLKNSEQAAVDYTVLEVQRYCELLVAGDPRCVETLYLDEDSVLVRASTEWTQLKSLRQSLLTRTCLDKYTKEAQGTTGLKRFEKWYSESGGREEMTVKQCKLAYIVLRLLQNSRDMVRDHTLHVYRGQDSLERQELLSVRQGKYTYSQLKVIFCRYLAEISSSPVTLEQDASQGRAAVQDWLLKLRLADLQIDST